MVRTVWALVQGTRRIYLVDDTCTFLEPVKRYLEALDIQGKSPNTLESYCRHLKHYFTFLEEAHLDWCAVTPDDLLRFVEWLRNPYRQLQVQPLHLTSRLSERSVNTILAAVASFYRYHVQRGQVLANPVLYEEVSNRFSRFKPFLYDARQADLAAEIRRLRDLPPSHGRETSTATHPGKSDAAIKAQIARLQERMRVLEREVQRLREENAVLYGRLAERS